MYRGGIAYSSDETIEEIMPRPIKKPEEAELKEELKDKIKEEPKQYLNIQDIQSFERMDNMAAWFEDEKGGRICKIPDLIGLLINEERNESIPTLLMLAADGTFVPPFLMAGFIGMFPEDQVFEEAKTHPTVLPSLQNPEVFDEAKVEEYIEKPGEKSIDLQAETEIELQAKGGVQAQEQAQTNPPSAEEQPKKKGILGIFNKKQAKPKEPSKEVSKETKDLLKELKDVST